MPTNLTVEECSLIRSFRSLTRHEKSSVCEIVEWLRTYPLLDEPKPFPLPRRCGISFPRLLVDPTGARLPLPPLAPLTIALQLQP